ncbi:MAG TPA: YggS family pyridoxal phosphate-dependent enzyme [bacterium]|nr:YggS family pyridoxal phosphate-dependent enzyme [bacterium]
MTSIAENIRALLKELPHSILLEAAAKNRTPEEVNEAIEAGVHIIGENYIQEAEAVAHRVLGRARFHFIGHLQTNKVKKAVRLFDMIETVDSLKLAREIDKRCAALQKVMEILIEINSGREPQKNGVLPEAAENLIHEAARLKHIRIRGLMTMGPFTGDPELARPFFKETARLFNRIAQAGIKDVNMDLLSMGMTNSYRIAVQEGANIVRIGTLIFGPR